MTPDPVSSGSVSHSVDIRFLKQHSFYSQILFLTRVSCLNLVTLTQAANLLKLTCIYRCKKIQRTDATCDLYNYIIMQIFIYFFGYSDDDVAEADCLSASLEGCG